MKKLISILAALVLTCMMSVNAMAAVSSPGKEVIPEKGTVTTTDGEKIDVNDSETLKQYIQIKNTDVQAENISGYSPLTTFDVVFNGITGADVILHVPGVKIGDTVIVRMFVNGQWVDVEAEVVGDDQIKVKLTQAGTIEIQKATGSNGGGGDNTDNSGNNSDGNTGANNTQGSNTSSKSPKTGETSALPAAYAVFAVCGVAAVAAGMKLRKKVQ
mgnify:FL=1